ncbi:MAG: transglycosylase domain-containing protein, partial [Candidatus Methylomirabilia bacterium]
MLHERCAAWLRRPRWSWPSQVVVIAASFSTLGVTVSVLWAVTVIPQAFPSPTGHGITGVDGSKLYDENDEVIAEFRVQRQFAVPLARIPQSLRDAVIAVEDSRFYSHFGIDPIGLARAVYRNVRHRRIVEGGSTITQQLARLLFLTHDKSFGRKLKEALLALELERRYSKDRILEMYLNQIYMSHGAYGVEAGARTYFGKSVTELALPEVALLAGLPRAPALYSPFNHPDRARRRRAHVLKRMVKVGAITPTERKAAAAADLGLTPPAQRRATGQYFVEHVRRLLAAKYGGDMVFRGGLRVYSTLSPHMQRLAEKALRDGLEALEARTVSTRLTRPG